MASISHSDQGPNFESRLFQEMCRILGIRKTRTTPYHPACDGLVERFNCTLTAIPSTCVDERQTDWDLHLPVVTMAYRSSVQESTGFTPNRLMLGPEINIPWTLLTKPPPGTPVSPSQYVQNLQNKFSDTFELVRQHVKKAQLRQKTNYDRKVHGTGYVEGDKVWLYTPRRKRGLSRKFLTHWTGPFEVVKKTVRCEFCYSQSQFPLQTNRPFQPVETLLRT